MNFLAHAHLSGDNDHILFGNFIADAVKGNGMMKFDQHIRAGIMLHRRIDAFTDSHVIFRESVQRIRPDFGRYSGIVVDIYYDHFLARSWQNYSDTKLPAFARHVYRILQRNYRLLPGRTKRMLPFLVTQNWLVGYGVMDDLRLVFFGMDRRTAFRSGMSHAVEVLEKNYRELKTDFESYYPLLQEYAGREMEKILSQEIQ